MYGGDNDDEIRGRRVSNSRAAPHAIFVLYEGGERSCYQMKHFTFTHVHTMLTTAIPLQGIPTLVPTAVEAVPCGSRSEEYTHTDHAEAFVPSQSEPHSQYL